METIPLFLDFQLLAISFGFAMWVKREKHEEGQHTEVPFMCFSLFICFSAEPTLIPLSRHWNLNCTSREFQCADLCFHVFLPLKLTTLLSTKEKGLTKFGFTVFNRRNEKIAQTLVEISKRINESRPLAFMTRQISFRFVLHSLAPSVPSPTSPSPGTFMWMSEEWITVEAVKK